MLTWVYYLSDILFKLRWNVNVYSIYIYIYSVQIPVILFASSLQLVPIWRKLNLKFWTFICDGTGVDGRWNCTNAEHGRNCRLQSSNSCSPQQRTSFFTVIVIVWKLYLERAWFISLNLSLYKQDYELLLLIFKLLIQLFIWIRFYLIILNFHKSIFYSDFEIKSK